MKSRSQWIGAALLVCVALAAYGLDRAGRARQPRHYTVAFESGSRLGAGTDAVIEQIAAAMAKNDSWEAVVVGHSGTRGDAEVNLELSRERAETVKTRLEARGVSPSRIRTFGVGGRQPLEKRPEEGGRSYHQRLKRAEVTLKLP
ncbi:MAG: OmpA family protein [Desulfatibacillaceae bacterium]